MHDAGRGGNQNRPALPGSDDFAIPDAAVIPCASPVTMFPPASGVGRWVSAPRGTAKGSAGVERPCGGCVPCRLNRIGERSLRMQLEARCHAFAYFITLTYAPEFLPPGATLVPDHLSGFLKRLRARLQYDEPSARVRFAGVGEYGEKGKRPHYHLMAYTGDTQLALKPWRRSESGELLHRSALVESAWGMGSCEIGAVTPRSCDYVAGYLLKGTKARPGRRGSDDEYLTRFDSQTGEVWKVAPEFGRYSNRPGIGAPWFQRWPHDVIGSDGSFCITLRGGDRRPVPGYFLRLLKRNTERVAAGLPPLDGLEDFTDAESLVSMARFEAGQKRAASDLSDVGGDRQMLAALRAADQKRVEEFWSHRVSQKKRTL